MAIPTQIPFEDLVAKVAPPDKFLSEVERIAEGARVLKRLAFTFRDYMGAFSLYHLRTTKSFDQMAELLCSAGIAATPEEGRELTPLIMSGNARFDAGAALRLEEGTNGSGVVYYRISTENTF